MMTSFRPYTFLLFIFLRVTILYGQDSNREELLHTIQSTDSTDVAKLDATIQLAWTYVYTDFDSCYLVAQQALSLADKVNDEKQKALAYNLMGISLSQKNCPLDSIEWYYQKALIAADNANDTARQSKIFNNLGLIYARDGRGDEAFKLYRDAMELAEITKDTNDIINSLNNMAAVFVTNEDFDKAGLYFKKSIDYAEASGDKEWLAFLVNNLAVVYGKNGYQDKNNLDTALVLYEQSIQIKEELKRTDYDMFPTLLNIGDIYIQQESYELADQYYKSAYNIADTLDYKFGLGLSQMSLGSSKMEQGDLSQSKVLLGNALDIFQKNVDAKRLMECYELLSRLYSKQGRYELAHQNLTDYNHLKDSLFNQEREEEIQKIKFNQLPEIQTNSSLIYTVFKNLIENGLKYNESPNPTVKISHSADTTFDIITIEDNGIGIDPNYHEKIFEMFKRLHGKNKYEGSGIGLTIVKLSVEKLGGQVSIDSESGLGSRFTLSLPKS